ncbi:hypothetical protein [Streptomyces nigrescens]
MRARRLIRAGRVPVRAPLTPARGDYGFVEVEEYVLPGDSVPWFALRLP